MAHRDVEAKGSYQIRAAAAADIDGVLACLAAAFEPYRTQYSPEGFADTVLNRNTLETRMRQMRVLVAISDGAVVGTIAWAAHAGEGHLRGMAVLPEFQGTTVAAALLQEAEREIRNQGCSRVTLDTTQPLQRAIGFYTRHGFAPSGRITDFFGMPLYEYVKPL